MKAPPPAAWASSVAASIEDLFSFMNVNLPKPGRFE
jgi:hypothetical protein